MHGIHHTFPQDRFRLVFPIVPGYLTFLSVVYLPFAYGIPAPYYGALIAGTLSGYMFYDVTHYFCHNSSPRKGYFRSVKLYHMTHHYKNGKAGFGLTTKFWDKVFRTELKIKETDFN